MADNKIQMPTSGGGLMRYSDEVKSNLNLSPYAVLFLIAFVSCDCNCAGALLVSAIRFSGPPEYRAPDRHRETSAHAAIPDQGNVSHRAIWRQILPVYAHRKYPGQN